MIRTERLHRYDGGFYRSPDLDEPDGGASLGHGLVTRFALQGDQPVTFLDPGECDLDLLAELVGPSAATLMVVEHAPTVELPAPRTGALQAAARLARALAVLRLPVARDLRYLRRADAIVAATDLADRGFDTGETVTTQACALLQDLAARPDALTLAQASPPLASALWRLDTVPGLASGQRAYLDDLLEDIPEPHQLLVAALEATRPTSTPDPSVDDEPIELDPIELEPIALAPEWLGTDDEEWLPLFWQLIAEEQLPGDEGFDGAVTVRFEPSSARVEVASHPGLAEVLFIRIVRGEELRSVDVLRPADDRWRGEIPLPEDFDRRRDRFEIVDSLARPVVADPERVAATQRDLVALAWSLDRP